MQAIEITKSGLCLYVQLADLGFSVSGPVGHPSSQMCPSVPAARIGRGYVEKKQIQDEKQVDQ